MRALKSGRLIGSPPSPVTDQVATAYRNAATIRADLAAFIQPGTVFVPVPRSSLQLNAALWIPDQLAGALSRQVELSRVARLLKRIEAIPKAATSIPSKRPTALRHFETLAVQKDLMNVEQVTLVDDVVTTGAALLGPASKLLEVYPNCRVRGLAGIRTISRGDELKAREQPVVGQITLRPNGSCLRRP
jgi:predicted amidophosphoribosyltransferase